MRQISAVKFSKLKIKFGTTNVHEIGRNLCRNLLLLGTCISSIVNKFYDSSITTTLSVAMEVSEYLHALAHFKFQNTENSKRAD